jgi:hypothetical protein
MTALNDSLFKGLNFRGVPALPLTLARRAVVKSSARCDYAGQYSTSFFIFTIRVAD